MTDVWRKKMIKAGICTRCGKEPRGETLQCEPCRAALYDQQKNYRTLNRDAYLSERRNHYRALREMVLFKYGAVCVCCGESHMPYLDLDHTTGGGNQERKTKGGGSYLYSLSREPVRPDLVIRCANCHAAKTRNSECSHPVTA